MDQYTHVTKRGYGSRIWGSIKGIVVGILLFIISFGVLYWNEGRVDLSKVAETAIEVSADSVENSADGQLVSVSGMVKTDETLGDGLYMNPSDYMALKRTVEMYAWIETTETETEKNLGGSETETTIYTYEEGWTEYPTDSSEFEHPVGHENPTKSVDSDYFTVSSATVGAYDINPNKITLPGFKPITLEKANLTFPEDVKLSGNKYLFKGVEDMQNPIVGDVRISYSIVPAKFDGTVFGKLNGSKVDPYVQKKAKLYRAFYGTRDEAIMTMATEHKILTWILRAVGFLMMWIGLGMVLGPVSVLLDVVPFFGKVSRFAIGAATFLVALVLSITTILVSMIFHNIIALIVIVALTAGTLFYFFKTKGKKKHA